MKIKRFLSFINENNNFDIKKLYKFSEIEEIENYFLYFYDYNYNISIDYTIIEEYTKSKGNSYKSTDILKLGSNILGYKITIKPSKRSKLDLTSEFTDSIRLITKHLNLKVVLDGYVYNTYDLNNIGFNNGLITYKNNILEEGITMLLVEDKLVNITYEQLADYYNWSLKTPYIDIEYYEFNYIITGENKYFSKSGKMELLKDCMKFNDFEPNVSDFKAMLSYSTLETILLYIIETYNGIDNFINIINTEIAEEDYKIDNQLGDDLIDYILLNYDNVDLVFNILDNLNVPIFKDIKKLIGNITRDKYVDDLYNEYLQKLNEKMKLLPKHEIIEKNNIKYYRFYFDNIYLDGIIYLDLENLDIREIMEIQLADELITINKITDVESYVDEDELNKKVTDYIDKKATN